MNPLSTPTNKLYTTQQQSNTLGKGMNFFILPAMMVWFIEFYGISTIVGYLMPNLVYIKYDL